MLCEDKKCPLYIECMERLETLPYCASKAAELATTTNQQLKAKIAAFVTELSALSRSDIYNGEIDVIAEKMRQLSAV